MINLRKKFTKWYYRKGYRMMYTACPYGDGVAEMIFSCPWWVKPLVELFFSPSVYYGEQADHLSTVVERRLEELKGDTNARDSI